VVTNLIALAIVPRQDVVAALGVGFGLSNVVGTIMAWRILSGRLGGLAGQQIKTSLVRMHAAAIPAAIFALIIAIVVDGALHAGKLSSAVVVVVGGGGALLVYVVFSRVLRVAEVTDLTAMVRSRLRR
jgi:putative peptidoglycan lipid II flippase